MIFCAYAVVYVVSKRSIDDYFREQRQLEQIVRSGKTEQRIALRARIVLGAAGHWAQVAQATGRGHAWIQIPANSEKSAAQRTTATVLASSASRLARVFSSSTITMTESKNS